MSSQLTSQPDTSDNESIVNKFFKTEPEVEDSLEDQPEAEDQEEQLDELSDTEESVEELDDDEAEDDVEEEDESDSLNVFGTEMTREDFKTMQDQQLMHADYTKKTQALATRRKEMESLSSDLSTHIAELEDLIVNEGNSEELEELLEDGDTAEYLRRTKQIEAKKAKLAKAKTKQMEARNSVQAEENQKLISVMTEWSDPKTGAATQKSDVNGALKYAGEIGLTNEDLEKIADHKIMRSLIDAGKYSKLKQSKPSVTKTKTKASKKVSKKSAVTPKKAKSAADLFYGSN